MKMIIKKTKLKQIKKILFIDQFFFCIAEIVFFEIYTKTCIQFA